MKKIIIFLFLTSSLLSTLAQQEDNYSITFTTTKEIGSEIIFKIQTDSKITLQFDWGNGEKTSYSTNGKIEEIRGNITGTNIKIYGGSDAIKYINCNEINITKLDVSKCPRLEYLYCENNQITDLNISNNPKLIYIFCEKNKIKNLDLSNVPELFSLWINNNELSEINLTKTLNLNSLKCDYNNISSINLKNVDIKNITCNNNLLNTCALNAMYESLHDRSGSFAGTIYVKNSDDQTNVGVDKSKTNIAIAKNFHIKDIHTMRNISGDGTGCQATFYDSKDICKNDLPYSFGKQKLTEEGKYNELFKDIYGNDSIVQLTLKILNQPESPIITQNNDTLSTNDASFYYWYVNNELIESENKQKLVLEKSGVYSVKISNETGCISELSEEFNAYYSSVIVNGIEVLAYPNPTKNKFFIKGLTPSTDSNLKLFNNSGQLLISKKVNHSIEKINLREYNSGTYIVIIDNHKNKALKIIKK